MHPPLCMEFSKKQHCCILVVLSSLSAHLRLYSPPCMILMAVTILWPCTKTSTCVFSHSDGLPLATQMYVLLAGNSSALGTFLYGSAYLTNTSTPAVVQNLTATIASIQLPQADTSEAFYQAILQSLQQPAGIASPDATATLVAAAVGAGAGPEVGRAFLQVPPMHAHAHLLTLSWSDLPTFCDVIVMCCHLASHSCIAVSQKTATKAAPVLQIHCTCLPGLQSCFLSNPHHESCLTHKPLVPMQT